jgi:hypothetical protein
MGRSREGKGTSRRSDAADARRPGNRGRSGRRMRGSAVVWDYKLTECYEKGDVISHPQFGRGFVEKITADSMEVIFREGRKSLAMNRPPTPEAAG